MFIDVYEEDGDLKADYDEEFWNLVDNWATDNGHTGTQDELINMFILEALSQAGSFDDEEVAEDADNEG